MSLRSKEFYNPNIFIWKLHINKSKYDKKYFNNKKSLKLSQYRLVFGLFKHEFEKNGIFYLKAV